MQTRSNGPDRTSQNHRRLFVTPALQIAKHDRLAITDRQPTNRLPQRRSIDAAGQIGSSRRYRDGVVERKPSPRVPRPALHKLSSDAYQKRGKRAAPRVESRGMMDQPHEHILRNLSGGNRVSSHMKCKSKDRSLVLTINGSKRLTIPSLESINKRPVIDHANLYCRRHPG